jgi:prepilin-type N-terminal cleavage/methylation domain-containing protein
MPQLGKSEDGFTIVEVLVAILIVSIGAMTTFSLLSAATRNAQRAEASQVALEFAEQELEFLRSMENEELALTASPPHSTNASSPNYRVTNGTFALQRDPLGNYRDLVVNGGSLYGGGSVEGGTIAPGPTPFTSGDVKGKVYRYVVWRNDEKCSEANCPGKQDFKQIVVAVKLDTLGNEAGERGYYEVQSNFIDPTDNAEGDPTPNASGNVVTAQQFFLTDTPCAAAGSTARQEITANHLLHNTLGTCAEGPQTGTTLGAPDALLESAAPPVAEGEELPPEYDYSNDTYLDTTPDTGTGVQIRKDDTPGCHFTPAGTSNPQSQVHRWVTDPMAEKFEMLEKATLQFYTESINKSSAPGMVCVFLYKWKEGGSPALLTNTNGGTGYWTYSPASNGNWPTEWEKIRLTMSFNGSPVTIEPGERLGLALSVERANTGGDALSFMYDHPARPARLEVDTSTPLEGG